MRVSTIEQLAKQGQYWFRGKLLAFYHFQLMNVIQKAISYRVGLIFLS